MRHFRPKDNSWRQKPACCASQSAAGGAGRSGSEPGLQNDAGRLRAAEALSFCGRLFAPYIVFDNAARPLYIAGP